MRKKKLTILEKAHQKWKQGKNKKSFSLYQRCAKMGDSACYAYLGYMYDAKKETKANKLKALYWYKKADKSSDYCHLNIANIYGLFGDRKRELHWLKLGAKRKDSAAMYNLAIYYREKNSMAKMKKWFKKSFLLNDGSSAFELAKIYLSKAKIKKAMKYLAIVINHPNVTLYEKEKAQLYLTRIQEM